MKELRRIHSLMLSIWVCSYAISFQAALPGSVVVWGDNVSGQTNVPVAAQNRVTAIAAGAWSIAALKEDGSVIVWGNDLYGQTEVPLAAQSEVTAIAAGGFHILALKADRSVVGWGDPAYGLTTVPLAQSGVIAIAAGEEHSVALRTNGSVVAWGWNGYGQTDVPVAAQSGVIAIAAGYAHTVALKSDGSVLAWGNNSHDQTSVPVAAQSRVIAIAAGHDHTVVLKKDGSVLAWGDNSFGQTNVPVAAQSKVIAIAAGGSHNAALKLDGSLVMWGDNSYKEADVPVVVQRGVITVATGERDTVALIPTAVSLREVRSGNAIVLSWPPYMFDFSLQWTPSLTQPVVWTDLTNVPALVGGQSTITRIISEKSKYYRLASVGGRTNSLPTLVGKKLELLNSHGREMMIFDTESAVRDSYFLFNIGTYSHTINLGSRTVMIHIDWPAPNPNPNERFSGSEGGTYDLTLTFDAGSTSSGTISGNEIYPDPGPLPFDHSIESPFALTAIHPIIGGTNSPAGNLSDITTLVGKSIQILEVWSNGLGYETMNFPTATSVNEEFIGMGNYTYSVDAARWVGTLHVEWPDLGDFYDITFTFDPKSPIYGSWSGNLHFLNADHNLSGPFSVNSL